MKRGYVFLLILLVVVLRFFVFQVTGNMVHSDKTCVDSDGGLEPEIKGEVSGKYKFLTINSFNKEDVCKNEEILIEYYCVLDADGTGYVNDFQKYLCGFGCWEGQCRPEDESVNLSPQKISIWQKIKFALR